MKTLSNLLFVAAFFLSAALPGQNNLFEYARWDTIEVEINGQNVLLPWAGGMNQPQFSEIDLDFDGTKDLFVFDRSGNNVRTYINNGIQGQVSYEYAPQFERFFPDQLDQFALLRDFNCDGKEDIFTYSPGGFRVFKNISDTMLKFEKITDYLPAIIFGNQSGVYVVNVDIPVIDDIDGDGDIDILAFNIFGISVHWYKNISTDCDTMIFERVEGCWGNFYESQLNDSIVLGASCKSQGGTTGPSGQRHTGATMLTLDMDNDGVKELVLGDVDYLDLSLLSNGGTPTAANMVAVDYDFPSTNVPVNLETFPAAYYLDLDNNGVKDLLVAPNDVWKGSDVNNVWYYRNFGANAIPNFQLQDTNLFVGDQLDHGTMANPVLADMDGDGLVDLLVGNVGYFQDYDYINFITNYISKIAYYKNVGTLQEPKFQLITDDLAGLSSLELVGIYPAVGDLDGDGDTDLLFGESNGNIYYYENTAGPGNPPVFSQVSDNYFGINVGTYPMPTLADLNGDTLLDLLIGEYNGYLHLYLNQGTANNAQFTQVFSDSLGGIKIYEPGYPGYPAPFVGRLNGPGTENILVVATGFGDLLFYSGIDTNLGGTYTMIDSMHLDRGRLAASGANLNASDSLELVVGQITGGLFLLTLDSVAFNEWPWDSTVGIRTLASGVSNVTLFPNPANETLNIRFTSKTSGKVKIVLYDLAGKKLMESEYSVVSGSNDLLFVVGNLPEGAYIVDIRDGSGHYPKKLIISR